MSLRREAIESADVCLKYYAKHPDEAIFKTPIKSIEPTIIPDEFNLTLYKALRSAEGLVIRLGENNVFENSPTHADFKVAKIEKKKVYLTEVSQELADALNQVTPEEDKQFESDKTFLVQRLRDWYENYGDRIRIPDKAPDVPVCFHPQIQVSENQKAAVNTVLTSPFSYIWGAPGTGKTKHVLATCIYSCLKEKKKILLTAPTNIALDQSLSGVLKALDGDKELDLRRHTLRLGMADDGFGLAGVCPEAVYERLMKENQQKRTDLMNRIRLLSEAKEIKNGKAEGTDLFPEMTVRQINAETKRLNEEVKKLREKYDQAKEKQSLKPFIDEFDLIAATADACIASVVPDGDFVPDHIFLDEAGYCSVIKGMVFTAFHCPLTLLGDHQQLPPVCDVSPKPADKIPQEETNKLFLWKFSAIAMEQVISASDYTGFYGKDDLEPTFGKMKKSSLTETHRFGPKLAEILAKTVYDRNFVSAGERDTAIWVIDAPKRKEDIGYIPGTKKMLGISQSEEDVILELILNNLGSEVIEKIGFLTPYTEHRKKLKIDIGKKLKKHSYNNVVQDNILSVHQSQGSEWDVVVVSVVDSLARRQDGKTDAFMMSTVRGAPNAAKTINTAVSRAKQLLILICDIQSWRQDPNQFVSQIIQIAEEHRADDPLPVKAEETEAENLPEEPETPEAPEAEKAAATAEPPARETEGSFSRKDGTALFGSYPQEEDGTVRPIQWKILEEKDGALLLVSEKCLDVHAFSERSPSSFWGRSSVREWLNNEFLQRAFTPAQRKAVRQTLVDNTTQQSDTPADVMSSNPTRDRVFLLSYREARQYFPDDRSRAAGSTPYALTQITKGMLNFDLLNGAKNRWILRNNSRNNFTVSVVDQFGHTGRRSGTRSRRMIRPAIWVEVSKMEEIKAQDCFICGAKEKGPVCPDCLNGKALDRRVAELESLPFDRLPEEIAGYGDKEAFYRAVEAQLPSPWKEYFRLTVLSSGRPYVPTRDAEEIFALCNQIKQSGMRTDPYAANRIGGLLLYAKTITHDYFGADEIANNLYNRPNLPYPTYYAMAHFYLNTRLYDKARVCLEKMAGGENRTGEEAKWIQKANEEYVKRMNSDKFYMPKEEANRVKLERFLKTLRPAE